MEEAEFVRKIKELGGHAYAAGGWVRDREAGFTPRDKDYVVAGIGEDSFCEAFPGIIRSGRAFPVYRMKIGGRISDVALARSETKSGRGYRGFAVSFSPLVTIEEDLMRRDTTINAMAADLETGKLLDPCGGLSDLRNGVIRAVSDRFRDDPVRALRAARQAAQFGFLIEPNTIRLMSLCHDELADEPKERLVNELRLALSCPSPSTFFHSLNAAGLLDVTFPPLHALAAKSRAAFLAAMSATDRAATLIARAEIRFAALACAVCLELSRGNSEKEASLKAPIADWASRMPLPRLWTECAAFALRWGKKAEIKGIKKPDEIRELLERLSRHRIGPDGLEAVMLAVWGKPPLAHMRELESAIQSVKAKDAPDCLTVADLGAWLRERRNSAIARILF
jgi:tRNA nucleotidyltransferase (CCA-adding enzyme)